MLQFVLWYFTVLVLEVLQLNWLSAWMIADSRIHDNNTASDKDGKDTLTGDNYHRSIQCNISDLTTTISTA